MSSRNYQETLDYLYSRLPMFSRVGARAMKPGLDNTIKLCEALGNPQNEFKSIHIAGTNGKGSTSHMLAAIFQQSGYKTGLYTSPHLIDFRERIRINGAEVSEDFVVQFVAKHEQLIEKIEPSFFEITVAMAFAAFAEQKVDIAVIETGLGGRLDSTNIITPELGIITNISYDHTDLLGDTLAKIAAEKAGIIKPGVPVIVGERAEETTPVFEEVAAAHNAPLTFAVDWWEATYNVTDQAYNVFRLPDMSKSRQLVLDLKGRYQTYNLQTVLAAHSVLEEQGWQLPFSSLTEALQNVSALTGLHGRYETLSTSPLIIADVGHNAAGLLEVLHEWSREPIAKAHIVVGFVKDKDVPAALSLFPKDAQYYFTAASIPRALPADELAEMGWQAGLKGDAYSTVADAVEAAKTIAGERDGILVTGSFFIVGEAMECLKEISV